MVTNEFKEYAESAIIHTYNRFSVAFDHGDGVYLYDTDGKKYLILPRVLRSMPLDITWKNIKRL